MSYACQDAKLSITDSCNSLVQWLVLFGANYWYNSSNRQDMRPALRKTGGFLMGKIPREQTLEMVRQVVLAGLEEYPVKVYLFGSWSRGTERQSSDIDIAIDGECGAPSDILVRLREKLEESTIPYRFDVVDLAEANPVLVDKVRKEGVLWKG
jgi:predicted nucleotidyltransferase